jgi:hypothetical protein
MAACVVTEEPQYMGSGNTRPGCDTRLSTSPAATAAPSISLQAKISQINYGRRANLIRGGNALVGLVAIIVAAAAHAEIKSLSNHVSDLERRIDQLEAPPVTGPDSGASTSASDFRRDQAERCCRGLRDPPKPVGGR